MSKIGCICGETIYDQTDSLPYKGYLLPDTLYFDALDHASRDVAAFLKARDAGTERQWLSFYFNAQYPSLSPEDIIHDIFTRHLFAADRDVYQCPHCRRVLVQRRDAPQYFLGFVSEDVVAPDIFT